MEEKLSENKNLVFSAKTLAGEYERRVSSFVKKLESVKAESENLSSNLMPYHESISGQTKTLESTLKTNRSILEILKSLRPVNPTLKFHCFLTLPRYFKHIINSRRISPIPIISML